MFQTVQTNRCASVPMMQKKMFEHSTASAQENMQPIREKNQGQQSSDDDPYKMGAEPPL